MKKILITLQTLLLLFLLTAGHTAWAESDNDPYYGEEAQYSEVQNGEAQFSMNELEDLVAPIALYPDPLIAQILPAATFVDQIDEAARYVNQYGRYAQIDRQYWDVSVKAVAHYPDVLNMMDQKYDWTVSLGQAFINQPDDVMYAIQLLRQDARAAGNLFSSQQQQVIIDNGYIRIIPAQPEVIYVPVYDPQVVYVERPSPGYGFITFGTGFSIGVWLNRDCDWRDRRVYYHGWRGREWVNRARPHVQVQNNIYVNQTNTVININQQVMRHNSERFREKIRQDVQVRRERHELPPSMRQDHRPREKAPKLDGGPVAGSAAPRPDQRKPGNYRIVGEKPTPAVPPRQPRTPSTGHEQQPRGRGDNRGERQGQLPGGQPRPSIPAGTPRPDQRIPGNYRIPGGKPTPAITPQQPRTPSTGREQQPRERGDQRGERQEQLPSGQPRPSVPAGAPRPDQRIPGNYRTPEGRPNPAVTPQQPRTPSAGHEQQPRGKSETREERQRQFPGGQPRPGVPAATPQQPRPGLEKGEKQSPPVTPSRPVTQPAPRDIYRGRDTQNAQPASRSGYGGYGTPRDATIYRERGRSSQETVRQPAGPAQQRPAIPQQAQPRRVAPVQQPVQRPTQPVQRPQVEHRPAPAPRQISPPAPAPRPGPAPAAAPRPAPAPPQQKAPVPNRDEREQRK